MLEQKIRFKHSIETRQPIHRVEQFYDEYVEAYKRLHNPSLRHINDYHNISEEFKKYKEEWETRK